MSTQKAIADVVIVACSDASVRGELAQRHIQERPVHMVYGAEALRRCLRAALRGRGALPCRVFAGTEELDALYGDGDLVERLVTHGVEVVPAERRHQAA